MGSFLRFFIAIWEQRFHNNGLFDSDTPNFDSYFRTGQTLDGITEPPYTNYRVIPWTYGP